MIRTRTLPIFIVLLVLCSNIAQAWLRTSYEDATLVDRSELIVVAHLKEGTIKYVPNNKPSEGVSGEHHATLVITEVLKGKCKEKEIPIIIHYGLTPAVGGYIKKNNFRLPGQRDKKDYPKDSIEIWDTGNSGCQLSPSVKDAREKHLWFLRKRSGTFGRKPGTGKYGIVDPEDIKSIKWKEYILAYMGDDPEAAVRDWLKRNPGNNGRAKKYLDHMEVQRILKVKDPAERYEKLLPFFLNRTTWNMRPEARDGIISCGAIAGERLKKVFGNPKRAAFRDDIILMWRDIGYKKAVPILIDLLEKHDQFWAKQDLKKGWWNKDVSSDQTRRRRDIYGEVYYGVCALRSFKDPKAKDVLKITRNRWKAKNFDNSQIVEECNAALRALSETEGTAQQQRLRQKSR